MYHFQVNLIWPDCPFNASWLAVLADTRKMLYEITCTNTWFLPHADWPLNRAVRLYLKGLSHEIYFKNFDKNLQNLT
jgi:hypothetical protein